MARRTAPASILLPALRAVLAASSRRMILGAALAALTVLAGMGLLGLSGWFIAATAIAGLQVISALTFDVFMPSAGIRLLVFDEPTAENWRSAFTKVNQFIRRQPYYIDLEPHFIDSKGVMQNRLAIDGLHPGLEGKELMAQIIERNWVRVTR